jgi:hypothetical protein
VAHDVFISYSHVDKSAADAACGTLEGADIRCWIAPRDISPGAEWGEAIVEAIDHATVMVLIFSSNANESRQVRREVERAVNKGVTIVPVRIEQAEPVGSLAYFTAGVQWLDALTAPLEHHFQRLVASVKASLSKEGTDEKPEFEVVAGTRRPFPSKIIAIVLIVTIISVASLLFLRYLFLTSIKTQSITHSPSGTNGNLILHSSLTDFAEPSGVMLPTPVRSKAKGQATVIIDKISRNILFDVVFTGLSGPTTSIALWCPPVDPDKISLPGVFTGNFTSPVQLAGSLSWLPDYQMIELAAGTCNITIYTDRYPRGEIRGPLIP